MKHIWEESDIKASVMVSNERFGNYFIVIVPNIGFALCEFISNKATPIDPGVFSCDSFIVRAKKMAEFLTEHNFVKMK